MMIRSWPRRAGQYLRPGQWCGRQCSISGGKGLVRSVVSFAGLPPSSPLDTSHHASGSSCLHHHHHRHYLSTQANDAKPFDKVLVANRGEIVQRVFRTCRDLDIETVAVYSTADAGAPFVQDADQAVCVGPAAASASYMNQDAVLEAARITGAQAIHPGYGFLSENASFAQAVLDAGLVWLGPPPSAVRDMGDKLQSKLIATSAGVNVIPGYEGEVTSVDQALQLCNETIGYPVLLKAAAGGGGKGMRVCDNDRDVKDAWKVAKAEALSFFGDDRLLVEKFIERPHHIEMQVLCGHDNDVAVFPERECSVQRRNQKVIEESPSCLLNDETRYAMALQVQQLCQAVSYQSAGTVEMLVDEAQNFYFLEMNTRLQVEHPVTEAVCDVDLVKGMLWVGAGWGLPPEYQERRKDGNIMMPFAGHAIEARIYAEDPLRGFLPSTGPLTPYQEPSLLRNTTDAYVRVDSGVAAGHVVTPHYDPMLSKVIAYAPTRDASIVGLQRALNEYVIEGVQHNARLVQSVLRHASFRAGDTPTSFLPTHYPDGFVGVQLTDNELHEFAVAVAMIDAAKQALLRPTCAPRSQAVVRLDGMFGAAYGVAMVDSGTALVARLDEPGLERTVQVADLALDRYLAHMLLDGVPHTIQVVNEAVTGEYKMQIHGADMTVLVQSEREYEVSAHMQVPPVIDTSDLVMSPMPGTLIRYAVQSGDDVEVGQELCVIEAMKMQNIIRSTRAGRIGTCLVDEGSSIMADQVIIQFGDGNKS